MVICEVCQERMELLVQVSWALLQMSIARPARTCTYLLLTPLGVLQINAPLDELPQAIYRTFYIYTCKKASCMSKKHLGR